MVLASHLLPSPPLCDGMEVDVVTWFWALLPTQAP